MKLILEKNARPTGAPISRNSYNHSIFLGQRPIDIGLSLFPPTRTHSADLTLV